VKRYPYWPGNAKSSLGFLLLFWSTAMVFPQKVVSLAPGITEIVFALNKGNTLVGVTKFCDYPAAAGEIKKIGGYLDVNTEVLVALAPDIVIMYPEHENKMRFLKQRARLVKVRHNRFSDLLESILEIGRVLNSEEQARELVLAIRNQMRDISSQVKGKKKKTAILIAGRNADELKNMYIIGKKDFFNDLLEIAGGVNAYAGDVDYPSISLESVIYLNPDFIRGLALTRGTQIEETYAEAFEVIKWVMH